MKQKENKKNQQQNDSSTSQIGNHVNVLKLKRLGIDTQREFILYLHKNSPISRSEGFEALTRIQVIYKKKKIIATLNVIASDLLAQNEVSLSESAWNELRAQEGEEVILQHVGHISSFFYVRQKLSGQKLTPAKYEAIIQDILQGKFSNTHLAAFVSACTGQGMSTEEIISLTQAMIHTGEKIEWDQKIIADKHCIGGLPGNRTTPIVVPIVAAAGLTIPKTSSRAITSPAGTTDTMEVMTKVNLSLTQLRQVVKKENACMVWGGSVSLSPVDDIIVRIERTLSLDGEGQMIASILSKKASAGATHVLIDIPVGPHVKVDSQEDAENLKLRFQLVGLALGLKIQVMISSGIQPVGLGIGPALEAQDILQVLRGTQNGLNDLKEKSLHLAGDLLELTQNTPVGTGYNKAKHILESGAAYQKFIAICETQGAFREPQLAPYRHDICAPHDGFISALHCGKLSRLAKLSGAPQDKKAGVKLHHHIHSTVQKGAPILSVFAESKGELVYALEYARAQNDIFQLSSQECPIEI